MPHPDTETLTAPTTHSVVLMAARGEEDPQIPEIHRTRTPASKGRMCKRNLHRNY